MQQVRTNINKWEKKDGAIVGMAVVSEVGKLVKDSKLPKMNWNCYLRKKL